MSLVFELECILFTNCDVAKSKAMSGSIGINTSKLKYRTVSHVQRNPVRKKSYTKLIRKWLNASIRVRSVAEGSDFVHKIPHEVQNKEIHEIKRTWIQISKYSIPEKVQCGKQNILSYGL